MVVVENYNIYKKLKSLINIDAVAVADCIHYNRISIKDLKNTLHQFKLNMKKKEIIPLCEPNLAGKEKKYLLNCIKTNYVSTVGNYVEKFEKKIGSFIKSRY